MMRAAHPLIEALDPLVDALNLQIIPLSRIEPTDVILSWDGHQIAGVRLQNLHNILGRLMVQVERAIGKPLPEFTREDKQEAVRILDELGAFTLRKGVEDVADALGVSRFTVYNYLHAIEGERE